MATIDAPPSTNMEAAFVRLHNKGAGACGARPLVVESILVDGKASIVALQLTPTPKEMPNFEFPKSRGSFGVGVSSRLLNVFLPYNTNPYGVSIIWEE